MKKYYLHDGENHSEPLSIQDLKEKRIKPETQVWYEGAPNWMRADQVEELKQVFLPVPPPLPSSVPPPMKMAQTAPIPVEAKVMEKKSQKWLKILGIAGFSIAAILFLGYEYLMYRSDKRNEEYERQRLQNEVYEKQQLEDSLRQVESDRKAKNKKIKQLEEELVQEERILTDHGVRIMNLQEELKEVASFHFLRSSSDRAIDVMSKKKEIEEQERLATETELRMEELQSQIDKLRK